MNIVFPRSHSKRQEFIYLRFIESFLTGPSRFERFMAAINRDRVDQLRTASFSWKLIAEDQKVSDRTLLRWRNSNDYVDPQLHRGIDRERVDLMRKEHITRNDIEIDQKVSHCTMWAWRDETQYIDPLPEKIEDNALMAVLGEYCKENPTRGSKMALGHIRSLGFSAIRSEVRAVMRFIDPAAVERRKSAVRPRGKYVSKGPHHVWHMDGWHKLIVFGFVVHGIIDGFSRNIMGCRCSDNNSANTVLRVSRLPFQEMAIWLPR